MAVKFSYRFSQNVSFDTSKGNCIFSDGTRLANWTKAASQIYSHGSSKPYLDLRLLLHGVKTPIFSNCAQLKTNHKIEVVLFDPTIEADRVQEYKHACLEGTLTNDTAETKHITLDMPVEEGNKEESSINESQVR